MPTYEYACDEGGHVFEAVQRFSDDPLDECRVCGAPVRRVIHPAGIFFKGDGWYVTANRSSSEKDKFKKDVGGEPADTSTSESKPIGVATDGDGSKNAGSSDSAAKSDAKPAHSKKDSKT